MSHFSLAWCGNLGKDRFELPLSKECETHLVLPESDPQTQPLGDQPEFVSRQTSEVFQDFGSLAGMFPRTDRPTPA